jgi:hypothetical protein
MKIRLSTVNANLKTPCGQAMVELLIILPVLLLLLLGAIQFALIYQAKITLNYAAYEGVRAGTLNHASLNEVRKGFSRGLAPLYAYSDKDEVTEQVHAFERARRKVGNEVTKDLVRIERINPTVADFKKFAPNGGNIANDHLRYRPSGTEDGSQDTRKGSIQNANLLQLRFTYWYPLYVPFVNRLIFDNYICCKTENSDIFTEIDKKKGTHKILKKCRWQNDIICKNADDKTIPRIPLTTVAAMRMQTSVKHDKGYSCRQEKYGREEITLKSLEKSKECI